MLFGCVGILTLSLLLFYVSFCFVFVTGTSRRLGRVGARGGGRFADAFVLSCAGFLLG